MSWGCHAKWQPNISKWEWGPTTSHKHRKGSSIFESSSIITIQLSRIASWAGALSFSSKNLGLIYLVVHHCYCIHCTKILIRDILLTCRLQPYSFSKLCNFSKKIIALYISLTLLYHIWHVLMYLCTTTLNNSAFRLQTALLLLSFNCRRLKKWKYFSKYNWHSAMVQLTLSKFSKKIATWFLVYKPAS